MTSALPLRTFVLEWILGMNQSDKSWTLSVFVRKIEVAVTVLPVKYHPDSVFPAGG